MESASPGTARPVRADEDNPGGAIAHLPALDGIRGVAILLVILIHFGVGAAFAARTKTAAAAALERVFYLGWSGVDLFFVLSGFLITSILLASKSQPQYFRRFYGRRVLRIFPLYYVALVLGLLVLPRALPAQAPRLLGEAPAGQVWLWTYTLNIAYALGWVANVGVLTQFWTLTIEEQYYLVWPSVVKKATERGLLQICVAMVAGALCLRLLWVGLGWPGGWQGAYRFTLARVDALAVGGMIAVLVREPAWRRRLERLAPAGLWIGLGAIAAMFLWLPVFYPSDWRVVTFGHSLLALTFGWLVVLAARSPPPRWLTSRLLRLLGKYSYGIYVWHWPLQQVLLLYAADRLTPAAFLAIGLVGSIALGWISYLVIERPFLHLKRFFAYGPRRAAVESTAVA
jgi:peptidoglycan/LPS O-acetylase OafA/YrhL